MVPRRRQDNARGGGGGQAASDTDSRWLLRCHHWSIQPCLSRPIRILSASVISAPDKREREEAKSPKA